MPKRHTHSEEAVNKKELRKIRRYMDSALRVVFEIPIPPEVEDPFPTDIDTVINFLKSVSNTPSSHGQSEEIRQAESHVTS